MNKRGFTLIELMIVVVIIGILAAVTIPAYQEYLKKQKGGLVGDAKTLTIGGQSVRITLKYPHKWDEVIQSVDNVSPNGGRPAPITPPTVATPTPATPSAGVVDGGTLTPKL